MNWRKLFKQKLTEDDREALYKLLDAKYHKIFRKKDMSEEKVWNDIRSLDDLLDNDKTTSGKPGCIRMEFYSHKTHHERRFGDFLEEEKTMVMRLKPGETSETEGKKVIDVLNHFFKGSTIRFYMEKTQYDGKTYPEIRTDMDKAQWAKLAIFCKYRFDREFPNKQERAEIHKQCQDNVDDVLHRRGKKWNATEGMPAWVAMAGMHGMMRPSDPQGPSRPRKIHELNERQISGTPHMFRGVPIHVDLNRHGELETTPYSFGFSSVRAALAKALAEEGDSSRTAVERVLAYINEAIGLDAAFSNMPPTARGLHGGVLLSAVNAFMEGKLEPVTLLLYAAGGGIIGFTGEQWFHIGSKEEIEKNPEILIDILRNQGMDLDTLRLQKLEEAANVEAIRAKAFSPENMAQLENLLRDTGVIERTLEQQSTAQVDKILGARLTQATSNIPRIPF